jgi:hypothetical protein
VCAFNASIPTRPATKQQAMTNMVTGGSVVGTVGVVASTQIGMMILRFVY